MSLDLMLHWSLRTQKVKQVQVPRRWNDLLTRTIVPSLFVGPWPDLWWLSMIIYAASTLWGRNLYAFILNKSGCVWLHREHEKKKKLYFFQMWISIIVPDLVWYKKDIYSFTWWVNIPRLDADMISPGVFYWRLSYSFPASQDENCAENNQSHCFSSFFHK